MLKDSVCTSLSKVFHGPTRVDIRCHKNLAELARQSPCQTCITNHFINIWIHCQTRLQGNEILAGILMVRMMMMMM